MFISTQKCVNVCAGFIWRPVLSAGTGFCRSWRSWAAGSVWRMRSWTNRCPSEETCPQCCSSRSTAWWEPVSSLSVSSHLLSSLSSLVCKLCIIMSLVSSRSRLSCLFFLVLSHIISCPLSSPWLVSSCLFSSPQQLCCLVFRLLWSHSLSHSVFLICVSYPIIFNTFFPPPPSRQILLQEIL